CFFFFFQAEDGIRDLIVTGVQTCALPIYRRLLRATGGAPGIRDFGALESAVAQPKATFGGSDLYPTLAEKAAALCLALVQGHPRSEERRVGKECRSGRARQT